MCRIPLIFLLLAILSCAASAWAGDADEVRYDQQQHIFQSVSPVQALRMIQGREDMAFLDVRTISERAAGIIPGSRPVSLYDLVKSRLDLPENRPILLVCAAGGRSYVVGQLLSRQGYQEVYNLSGGVDAWYRAGLPLVRDIPPAGQSASP